MRVLVACEYSGAVRDAFRARGHDAMSCDLLPTDVEGPHYQGDVFDVIADGFDLLVAHPPCTYLCRAGARWLHDPAPSTPTCLRGADRWKALEEAAEFFRALLEAPIPRIAVENPRPYSPAAKLIGRRPDQYVHPWEFGHPENKETGLWLRGLPPLLATGDDRGVMRHLPKAVTDRIHNAPRGPDRWKVRSTTYAGIAGAMADQWGGLE